MRPPPCVWVKSSKLLEFVTSYVYLGERDHYVSWEKGIIVLQAELSTLSLGMFGKCEWWSVPQADLMRFTVCVCVCVWMLTHMCCACTPTLNWFLQKVCRVLQTCELCMIEPQHVLSSQREKVKVIFLPAYLIKDHLFIAVFKCYCLFF